MKIKHINTNLFKDLSGNTLTWNIILILIPYNSHKKLSFKIHLTKRYFVLAGIDTQCDKYIFRGIENTKNGQKLRKIDKPISYTTVRGHFLDLLANICLDPKKFELHSLRSGGGLATTNLGVNSRLFKNTVVGSQTKWRSITFTKI